MKPTMEGKTYCPRDANLVPEEKGKPMWNVMALPFHLVGKMCKKCGEPVAEHIMIFKEVSP